MRTLSTNFKAALRESPNTPSFIVKAVQSEQFAEVDSQTDWLAYKQAVNVDLTTEPGSVLLPKVSVTGITQTTNNATVCFGSLATNAMGWTQSPATPGTDSFAWQSLKQSSGQTRYVDKVAIHLYATGILPPAGGTFYNYFYVQLFDAKGGAAISSLKAVGGAMYSVNSLISFDFSSENIPLLNATTYWIKIYGLSKTYITDGTWGTTFASCYARYQNTSVYADGQADVKPYSGAESVNAGDAAFTLSFLNQYSGTGFIANQLYLGSTPTVDGEWRINTLTPQDSSLILYAHGMDSLDTVSKSQRSAGSGSGWLSQATNGHRIVRVGYTSPYMQYSDDAGITWNNAASGAFSAYSVVFTGTRWIAVAASGNTSKYSTDGSTWSAGGNLPASGTWIRMVWTGTTCFTMMYGGQGATSVDGSAWTARTMAASSKNWRALGWNGTNLLAVESGTTYAATSDGTGVSWTPRTLNNAFGWESCIYAFGKWFVFVNTSNEWNESSDLSSWTLGSNGLGTVIPGGDVAFDGVLAVAVGLQGYSYSTDGINWTYTDDSGVVHNSVILFGGLFLTCGTSHAQEWALTRPGHVEIGSITDGQAITDLKQYYSIVSFLSPDTTGSWTPALQYIQAYFPTWVVFSTTPEKGYEPAINTIGSLSATIDSFKPFTVGQVSLGLALTDNVSTWLNTAYPRNKEVRIYAGFTSLAEADYADYYRGRVEEWSIGNDRKVTVSLRDYAKSWKDKPVPLTWQSVTDDKTWTAQHPVDIMLDILQGYIGAQSTEIDSATFASVKTELSGWVATNTITGETSDSAALLEQLRFITGTYFIPQSNGRIKLKRWDPTEVSSFDLTDNEMIGVAYKGNSASLVNLLNWYFNMKPDGTAKAGGIALHQEQDGASQFNWGEKKTKEFKDYWTLTAEEIAQVYPVAGAIITRYAQVPDVVTFQLDLRFMELEVGDMVTLTTKVAPSSDLNGISAVKYQITRCDLDFAKSRLKLEVLRAA